MCLFVSGLARTRPFLVHEWKLQPFFSSFCYVPSYTGFMSDQMKEEKQTHTPSRIMRFLHPPLLLLVQVQINEGYEGRLMLIEMRLDLEFVNS